MCHSHDDWWQPHYLMDFDGSTFDEKKSDHLLEHMHSFDEPNLRRILETILKEYQGKSFNEDKTNKPKLSKLFKGFDNSHYGLFIWFKQNKQWKSTTSFVLLKIIRFGANWKESFPSGPFWLTFDSIESVLFSSIWLFFKQKCFLMFPFLQYLIFFSINSLPDLKRIFFYLCSTGSDHFLYFFTIHFIVLLLLGTLIELNHTIYAEGRQYLYW